MNRELRQVETSERRGPRLLDHVVGERIVGEQAARERAHPGRVREEFVGVEVERVGLHEGIEGGVVADRLSVARIPEKPP